LAQAVVYSKNEHFVALSDSTQALVYDIRQGQELRRIDLASPQSNANPFSTANLAFARNTDTLYVRRGSYLLACNLDDSSDCATLQSNLQSSFVLSSDDLIAYVTSNNQPVLLDPKANRVVGQMQDTIAKADEEDFSWSKLALLEAAGHPIKLAIAGEIDRDIPSPNAKFRDDTTTVEEWHMSSFDLRSFVPEVRYTKLPLSVDASAFDPSGRLLLCGTASKDAAKDEPPSSVYSVSTRAFLTASQLQVGLPEEISQCLGKVPLPALFGSAIGSPANLPTETAYRFGAFSPRRDRVVYAQNNAEFQNILYLGYPGTKRPPTILAGNFSSTSSVEFVPERPVLITRGLSTRYWNFLAGGVSTFSIDGRLSADLRVSAAFLYHFENKQAKGADLWLQDNTTGQRTQTSVHVSDLPDWYQISAHGDAVIYEIRGKLFSFINGASKDIPCHQPVGLHLKPSLDSTRTLLTAVCERDRDDPAQSGLGRFLITWQLPSLTEGHAVQAEGFDKCASLGASGKTALLCNDRKLRIIALETNAITDIAVPKSGGSFAFLQTVEDAQLQKDDETVVFTMRSPSSSQVEWINAKDNSVKTSVTLNGIYSFSTDGLGDAAVLDSSGIVSVFNGSGARRMRLVPVGLQDWLLFSETGAFDGTAGGLKWASYRSSPSSPPVPIDTVFDELYVPGLSQLILAGADPRLPHGLSLSTILDLPGTQSLIQNSATPSILDGKAVVCFDKTDVFEALRRKFGQSSIVVAGDVAQPACANRIVLSDQTDPQATVNALLGIKSNRIVTPWDNLQVSSGGTVHLLTIAVGKYTAQKGLQPVPTAVPAMERLKTQLKSHYAGEHLVDWDEQCGGDLYNDAATKIAILSCLDKMTPTVHPEDMVILIFAGHGGTATTEAGESELFYFYPADVAATSTGLENAISSAELADKLRNVLAYREVIVMDACDSGASLSPLEGAALAKMRQPIVLINAPQNASSIGQPAQGTLLVSATVGVEDAVGSAGINPFLDRLVKVLTADGSQPVYAREVAKAMSAPLVLKQPSGPPITVTPIAAEIGADFAVTKP
jgi:hypothetical protein